MKALTSAIASATILLATATSQAALITYNINLDGPSESPANASPGTGTGTVIFDTVLHTMAISMSFTGLTGTATAAHIHAATAVPFTGTAGVATTTPSFVGFPLGVTSGSFNSTLDLTLAGSYNAAFVTANGGTTAGAESALLAAAAGGNAYFNIHTTAFASGEIRSFLTPVPEPATVGLLGVGGMWLLARRNRKK